MLNSFLNGEKNTFFFDRPLGFLWEATCLNGIPLDRLLEMDAAKCPRTRVDKGFELLHADRLIFGAMAK